MFLNTRSRTCRLQPPGKRVVWEEGEVRGGELFFQLMIPLGLLFVCDDAVEVVIASLLIISLSTVPIISSITYY